MNDMFTYGCKINGRGSKEDHVEMDVRSARSQINTIYLSVIPIWNQTHNYV